LYKGTLERFAPNLLIVSTDGGYPKSIPGARLKVHYQASAFAAAHCFPCGSFRYRVFGVHKVKSRCSFELMTTIYDK
jgi:hypothetical protein